MFNETHLEAAEHYLWKAKTVLTVVSISLALVELGYAAAVDNERRKCGNPDCDECYPESGK